MPEPEQTAESATLLRSLTSQRGHVLGILEGLSDADLRRPVLPSGWTCLGLIHHLAIDVERFWFRNVMAGEPISPDDEDAWQVGPQVRADDVLSLYRQEIDLADAIVMRTDIEAAPAWWPDFFPSFRYDNLRAVMLHVLAETACHAGHLDAVRELIDGRTWLVLT